jgi:starvation-inducible DNA-binding protein
MPDFTGDEYTPAALAVPSDLGAKAIKDIATALTELLADVYTLHVKTKNFQWHMSGRTFRDHYLLLDDQATQLAAMTDEIAERARKIGGMTLRSVGQVSRLQRIPDNDDRSAVPHDMLSELRDDNKLLIALMREMHELCDENNDVATASLLENWIDEAEGRHWFLFEVTFPGE